MTAVEYIDELEKKEIDSKKIKKIQEIYAGELPNIIKKIVSHNSETIFLDEGYRIFSYQEIVDAEHDLHVSFKEKRIIPIVDCGENDFIVYWLDEKIWSKFNIVDEIVFKKRNTLIELLK